MSNSLRGISDKAMFLANIIFALSLIFQSRTLSYAALLTWMISLILKLRQEKSKVLISVYSAFILFIIVIIVYPLISNRKIFF